MKIELKREEKGIDIVNFYNIFEPETVEETLLLKDLEKVRRDMQVDGSYHDKWEDNKFIIYLT